jgi:hypothetical protein
MNKYLRRPMDQILWAKAHQRHLERERLGRQQYHDSISWPSTDKNTTEGARGATSPLGGIAKQKKESH